MSKGFRFELDIRGLQQLLKSEEMQGILDEYGAQVAGRAGDGYGYRTHVGDFTSITNVFPETKEAAKDNYENNTLLKAVGK